LNLYSVDKASC